MIAKNDLGRKVVWYGFPGGKFSRRVGPLVSAYDPPMFDGKTGVIVLDEGRRVFLYGSPAEVFNGGVWFFEEDDDPQLAVTLIVNEKKAKAALAVERAERCEEDSKRFLSQLKVNV